MPEFRLVVPAIGKEIDVFPVGGQACGDAEVLQQDFMARSFIVESKTVFVMADGNDSAGNFRPVLRGGI